MRGAQIASTIVAGLVGLAGGAAAQEAGATLEEVRWDAELGLSGNLVVESTFNAFRLELDNTLRDFDGTVRIFVTRAPEVRFRQPTQLIYEQPLSLPVNSRKVLEGLFYCPVDESEIEIHLIEEDGSAFIPPQLVGFVNLSLERRTVLIVSRRRNHWEGLRTSPDAVPGLRRQTLYTAPEAFPRHWAALGAATTVLWDGERWPALAPEQGEALGVWVERGGVLAVGTGPDWPQLAESPLADLLPVTLTEARTISPEVTEGPIRIDLENPLTVAGLSESSLPPGSRVMARLGERPLLVSWPHGSGHVLLCTSNLEALFRAAGRKTPLLESLLTPPGDVNLPQAPMDATLRSVGDAIAQISRISVPEAWSIGRWLLVLWILIVPVNFSAARMLGRPRLAWWMVPVIALGSTAVIFERGISGPMPYQSGQQIQFAVCSPGAPSAHVQGLVALFSPVPDQYTLRFTDSRPVLTPFENPGAFIETESFNLTGGDKVGLRDFPLGFRALRTLTLMDAVPNPVDFPVRAWVPTDHLRPTTLQWGGALQFAADRWYVICNGEAWAIPEDAATRPGQVEIAATDLAPLSELFSTPGSAPVGDEVSQVVIRRLSDILTREASRLGSVTLMGLRTEALTSLAVTSTQRPQPEHVDPRLGAAVLLVPAECAVIPLAPGATVRHEAWEATVHSARPMIWARRTHAGHSVVFNAAEDAHLILRPLGSAWRSIEPDALEIRIAGRVDTSTLSGGSGLNSPRAQIALFSWTRGRWVLRSVPLNRAGESVITLRWEKADEYMHPFSGEAVAAVWATGDVPSVGTWDTGTTLRPPAPNREVWDWRRGPNRRRDVPLTSAEWIFEPPEIALVGTPRTLTGKMP